MTVQLEPRDDLDARPALTRELLAGAARCLPGAGLGQNALPPGLAFVVERGEGTLYPALAHTEADVDFTLDVMDDALRAIR